MLPVADYLYRSGKGVFYPPKTTKGKKKEGKCGEKGKKMREEKREKDKGRGKKGQKEGKGKEQSGKDGKSGKKKNGRKEKESGKEGKRKTENDKERNGIKPQALYNHAPGFLVTKKTRQNRVFFSI